MSAIQCRWCRRHGRSQTCMVAKSMLGHAMLPTKSTPFQPPLILHHALLIVSQQHQIGHMPCNGRSVRDTCCVLDAADMHIDPADEARTNSSSLHVWSIYQLL